MNTTFLGLALSEIIGYLASAVVLISFLNKDIVKLRIINGVGCGLFVAYGFLLNSISWPIIVTNFCILLIHLYYLLLKQQKA